VLGEIAQPAHPVPVLRRLLEHPARLEIREVVDEGVLARAPRLGPQHVDPPVARKRKRELDELPHLLLESGFRAGLDAAAQDYRDGLLRVHLRASVLPSGAHKIFSTVIGRSRTRLPVA
jgi:hypothetical protein